MASSKTAANDESDEEEVPFWLEIVEAECYWTRAKSECMGIRLQCKLLESPGLMLPDESTDDLENHVYVEFTDSIDYDWTEVTAIGTSLIYSIRLSVNDSEGGLEPLFALALSGQIKGKVLYGVRITKWYRPTKAEPSYRAQLVPIAIDTAEALGV